MRIEDHDRARVEVTQRLLQRLEALGDDGMEKLLAEALYHEKQRSEREPQVLPPSQREVWRRLQGSMVDLSANELRRSLREVIEMYVTEIIGNLDPRVFALTTKAIPLLFTVLLNAVSIRSVLEQVPRGRRRLRQNVVACGHTETLKRLHRLGRIMLVPTHSSHLDSVVVGWLLHELKLPPFLYGAGLNLFTNPMLSFAMQNNGAYRVDRKKRFELYKEVLKEFCVVGLEFGYDQLFFPGGTRSRTGGIERHLKLGLLGSALRAYQNNLRAGTGQARIYVVPVTLSYHLVLEAETLIDDFLQEAGKSRYIIEDDEATSPRRVYDFLNGLFSLNGRVYCSFGRPLDPFGNDVNDEGESLDGRGRPIRIEKYVQRDGILSVDEQRDREYTCLLGERIASRYLEENVVLSTHLVASALWGMISEANPGLDLYRLLRTTGRQLGFVQAEVVTQVGRLRDAVQALNDRGRLRIDPYLKGVGPGGILEQALLHFKSYHHSFVLERRGERIFPGDLRLLYYYRNRLMGYGLDGIGI